MTTAKVAIRIGPLRRSTPVSPSENWLLKSNSAAHPAAPTAKVMKAQV